MVFVACLEFGVWCVQCIEFLRALFASVPKILSDKRR